MSMLKSPLTFLGLCALALGVAQLLPIPAAMARRLSPVAQEVWATGTWSRLVQEDDPDAATVPPAEVRSPATLDRAATLRWLVGGAACLAIFWTASHFVDRRGRLFWMLGSVLGIFLLNTAMGIVQLGGGTEGLFGCILPGRTAVWGPTLDDLLDTPVPVALRRVEAPSRDTRPAIENVAPVPERPRLFGTMMGGPGALLAMGSMALPLGLAVLLHVLSPRGSRENFGDRLGASGQGGLAVLLTILLSAGAFLAGMMSGPWFVWPFAAAMVLAGLGGIAMPGARWAAGALTMLLLASLGLGATSAAVWPEYLGSQPPVPPISWESTRRLWTDCRPILEDFPTLGTGLGTFPTVHAYFKSLDVPQGPAMSSALRCAVESGWAGIVLVALAALWSVCRLPFCLKRVGSADRALAHGLIGAAVGFTLWSILHWTVELPAVAISASALGGTWNRWLAGGTDLFVDRA
jgi:MFS family permease